MGTQMSAASSLLPRFNKLQYYITEKEMSHKRKENQKI